MTTLMLDERRRRGTALMAVGAMLIAVATVLFVGQQSASANHASAPEGCFIVAGGANVDLDDLVDPIVVNGVTITFSEFTTQGQQVTQFDWSASGGTAELNFRQQGGAHQSSGAGATDVGTGQGAINHFYICGTPEQVDDPFECPEGTEATVENPESIEDCEEVSDPFECPEGTEATVENPESIADCEEAAGADPFECPEGTVATVENPESIADCEETAGPPPFECPEGTTALVDNPISDEDCALPETGPGQLLAALMGGTGLLAMGSGSLVIASDRRRRSDDDA